MNRPCNNDNRFIGTADQMHEAKASCLGCPVVQACGELGLGEEFSVYGGMTPTDPIREAHRESNDPETRCKNGHRLDLFSWAVWGGSKQPIIACRRCADLARYVAESDGTQPIPTTLPKRPDLILDHGTEAGYRAHKRRGERPCGSCKRGYALERARISADLEAS